MTKAIPHISKYIEKIKGHNIEGMGRESLGVQTLNNLFEIIIPCVFFLTLLIFYLVNNKNKIS